MVQIVLIRPGSTDYDVQGRIQGTLEIPLNDQGREEVEQMIGQLVGRGIETIYCSDMEPAVQTAEMLGTALEARVKKMSNMQNLYHGLWQGMLIDEVKHKQPKVYRQWQEQPDCICPPEGEMLGSARQRVSAAMTRLLKKHKSGTIAIVVPEPLASVVRCFLGCGGLGNLWRAGTEGEGWEVIEVGPQTLAATR
jgi:broad specificity phosphatase PhoE